ncbi:MAG: AAA family ATPase [Candidatus Eisenbacteria bacterium]|nr:AAA family ATPase [Candidatus Latescibacterota bacterium]MBD3302914.1 AAA family ATPase [Candidatus Eisenbacteria bacterium]
MKSFAIANIKGGCGKTTVAVNLAAGLALSGKRVCLFDLDPQSASTFHLVAAGANGNLADCLASEKKLPEILARTLVDGLTVAPGTRLLAPFDNGGHPTRDRLRQLLGQVPPEVDYVLFDTPPTWGSLLIASLSCVDAVLIPVATRELDLRMLQLLQDVIDQIRRHRNPSLRIAGILPNRTIRTRLSGRIEGELRTAHGPLVYPPIRETARLAEAGGFHAPIQVSSPSSAGAADFEEVTRAFLEREERSF